MPLDGRLLAGAPDADGARDSFVDHGGGTVSAASLAVLLLADGRLPSGGHAHSGGMEAAIVDGRVGDLCSLEAFLVGRLATTGLMEASMAAATTWTLSGTTEPNDLIIELDAETDARVLALPLRVASRRLGRQLARVAGRCWPHPALAALATAAPDGAHQPVALGTAAVAAGITVADTADLAVHHALTTPSQAAVRLLGLDPFAVAALTADLAPLAAGIAAQAVELASGPFHDLPGPSGPVLEIAAVDHALRDGRMFAT